MSFEAQDYPGQSSYFKDAYQKATSKTYGYLLVDMNPASEDRYRLQTHTRKHHSIFTERIIQEKVILKTMSNLVTSNAAFLKMLYSADPKQRKTLLKTMTENQQQALCEVIFNVYKGTFSLTKYYITQY